MSFNSLGVYMKKIYIAIIGLVVIAGGVTTWQLIANKKFSTSGTTNSSQTSSISAMQKQYQGYKGATYDRMFLAGMIAHHTGAIDMANLALANAKHQEIKDLATAIVSAQTSEISSMTSWQTQWGYPATSGANMQDHSAMMMEDEMAGMTNSLKGKTGDDFDKAFLTEMMAHHQQAIDMSKPAAANASHQEVKTLASNIITAQTGEISKMKMWQAEWGYTQSSSSDSMSGMHM
jgi:uncharacterized protein (DUF305 family)